MKPMSKAGDHRGVILIEALVALLIVAFGMVAMMGLQSTLRRSSDLTRQRGEALRLAQQDMEQLRAFSVLRNNEVGPDTPQAYEAIASTTTNASPELTGGNTDFIRQRVVSPAGENLKAIRITVSWLDRAADPQQVVLNSHIAGIDPILSAALTIAPDPSPLGRPSSSDAALPAGSKYLGGGRSVYKPLAQGTVAWIFNNATGVITGVCTVPAGATGASLGAADLSACQTKLNGYLLSGAVRFSWASPPDSENPIGPARALGVDLVLTSKDHPLTPAFNCYTDSPVAADPGQSTVRYSCIVYPNSDPKPIWSGYVDLTGLAFKGVDAIKVCRYSADYDGDLKISNAEHPLAYNAVSGSLRNQNFLVIKGSENCPAGHAIDPAQGYFRNTITVLHQDATTPSHSGS